MNLLKKNGQEIPSEIESVVELTDYAVEARYPGTAEPVTLEEYKQALESATKAVRWAERLIKEGKP